MRLGKDKAALKWHGKEQRFFMADLLKQFCKEVFISCRKDQEEKIRSENYCIVSDTHVGSGPFCSVISAFEMNENCGWLVIACDLPLLDNETVFQLVEERDPNYIAITFESPYDGLPEPLITIWESKSYPILLNSFQEGNQSLRKILLNNKIKIVPPGNKMALKNVNTAAEFVEVSQILATV